MGGAMSEYPIQSNTGNIRVWTRSSSRRNSLRQAANTGAMSARVKRLTTIGGTRLW